VDSAAAVADQEEEAPVAVGKSSPETQISPIVRAIAWAEKGTTSEIRVHITRKVFEKDPFSRAQKLFERFGMFRTSHRNAVLLYVNLRRRKFAIVGDTGIHQKIGQAYWEELAHTLREDLLSTHYENAIAIAVRTLGITLKTHFPVLPGAENPNELPDLATED
jgi:uncharacterized membrane protein